MKSVIFCLFFTVMAGCSHVNIPEAPKFRSIEVIYIEDLCCMDVENVAILWENLQKMKAYNDALRKELEKK